MLISLNWLKDYVEIKEDVKDLADRLTMSGSNVEGLKDYGKDIKDVIIGEIVKIDKHPNADKLLLTKINICDKELQIITGATNIKVGDRVPVAIPGAVIADGKKIKKTKLRNLLSEGMLCSAKELGIDDNGLPRDMREGILILPTDAPVGCDIKEYLELEDVVIDFEITPNRPDCLSVMGIAREVAATLNSEMKSFDIYVEEKGEKDTKTAINVNIEADDLCARYIARVVEDVKLGPSPLWMQRRLQVSGVRPINNIVDITNYVMLELGQPLHAFDYDKIEGKSINIRRGRENEKIKTLDGNIRDLTKEMLVIADAKKPLAIAGVMGGANSEISDNTKNILLESANFYGPCIRRTSRKLGLRSEASMRFEKNLDPNLCHKAMDRACQLIEQLGAGKISKGYVDIYKNKRTPRRILFDPKKINKILGTDIDIQEMLNILNKLSIDVKIDGKKYCAVIPTFRYDIKGEEDLAEEICRIYGYDKLPTTLPEGDVTIGGLNFEQKFADIVKETLVGCGFSEIYTYSITSPKSLNKINAPESSSLRKVIKLMNPLGEDHSVMRTTMLPSMLDAICYNLNQKIEPIKLFEYGRVYIPQELPLKDLPSEVKKLSIGLYGKNSDFFDLKQSIETLFTRLKIKNYRFRQFKHFAFHIGRCAKIYIKQEEVGIVGEVCPDITDNYEIKERVYLAELDLETICKNASFDITFKPLPRFPASTRDLAIVVEEKVPVGDIIYAIKDIGGRLLEEVEIFDIYKGEQIGNNYKSLAFSLIYRSKDRTLTDAEVEDIHGKIKMHLVEKFNGRLRE